MTEKAKAGDTVRVHYTGTLDSGQQFDSSEGREPLEFTLGADQVISGFDAAVTGMEVGESKTVRIPAEEAYGPRHEELVVALPKNQVPPGMEVQPGQQLQVQDQNGQVFNVVVVDVTDEAIILDGNHPLAGEALNFELKLVSID
ncbi:MAG: peptidylprolyl isomerase [Caldilineae bacterium]|nr:MAG: peptidylprolyl isomerase [Caldilineae bacterium]